MLFLVHGDDQVSSRKILYDKKAEQKDSEIQTFDGNTSTLTDYVSYLDALSFFSKTKVLVVENFFAKALSADKEKVFAFFKQNKERYKIFFWEGKEIDKYTVPKYFSREESVLASPPLLIFKFLDSLGIENKKTVVSMFQTILKQRDAFFILSMLYRQFRLLIIAVETKGAGMGQLSPWQAKKFISQGRYFSLDQLKSAYRVLLSMEYNVKSGNTPLNLAELLDIFLVTL